MSKDNKDAKKIILGVSSFIIVTLHTVMFGYVLFYSYNKVFDAPLDSGGYLMVVLYLALLVGAFNIMDALRVGYNKKFNIILSHIISILIVNVMAYLQLSLIHRAFLPIHQILLLSLSQAAVSAVWTVIVFEICKKRIPITKLLLVYGDKKAEELIYKILEREDQYRICETIQYFPDGALTKDNMHEVEKKIKEYSSVIIYRLPSNIRNDLLKFCYKNDITVYLPPRLSDIIVRGAKDLNQFDSPLLVCRVCTLSAVQRFLKRLFDILISVVGIIISSPVMIVTAIAIKAHDGGPVIFKQKRVTINERVFDIYKFRSMIVGAEKDNQVIPASEDDPRITPTGKIIRKLRIDELPQLFNIFFGDMSFVGPRPERTEHHKAYTQSIPEFPYRTKVKAGLTGYAQVMGKYNTSPYDKLLLDLTYIQKFSFFLDIQIILLTIKIVFIKESTDGFKTDDKSKGAKL